jgi:hypothetical protein
MDLVHWNLANFSHILDRTMRQDFSLRISLLGIPYDVLYHISHRVSPTRQLNHISSRVRLPSGRRK